VSADGSKDEIPISAATRKLFSYVPQDNILFAGAVAENLRLVKKDATYEELNEALRIACAYNFVHRSPLGLNRSVKEQGGGFSEGQLQRLSIARALLVNAPVLLLDEATSALDMETEEQLIRNLMEARKNYTCIIATHRPSVLRICDRIYRVQNGKIGGDL
jgi:ABC-type multidrug transport system fused ATPase/permease subunit